MNKEIFDGPSIPHTTHITTGLQDVLIDNTQRVITGIPILDRHIGGFPTGRISDIVAQIKRDGFIHITNEMDTETIERIIGGLDKEEVGGFTINAIDESVGPEVSPRMLIGCVGAGRIESLATILAELKELHGHDIEPIKIEASSVYGEIGSGDFDGDRFIDTIESVQRSPEYDGPPRNRKERREAERSGKRWKHDNRRGVPRFIR